MRNNPGGLVDEAEGVADEFLTSGVIYTTRHRGQVVDEIKAHAGGAFAALPIMTLVNEYSASSAELVSGALQDNHRATIVGAPTFGKGSVQTIFDLPGGAGLRLTTMRYYTPSGRTIQAEGIRPDVLIQPAKPIAATDLVRESDLEGHLSAEQGGAPKPGQIVMTEPEKAAGAAEIEPGRDVPVDPSKGTDFTLSVSYSMLLKNLAAKP